VTTAGVNTGNVVQSSAIAVKQTFLDGLHHVLPEPEAGLAGGITVGDKRSIGPALTADFQKVSLTQILVLSGYNITVVANFFAHVLSWAPSVVRFGSGIFVVVFFMLISGGASSAVRAGLMALLAMYARTSLRAYDALRALAVVVVAMVLWNPWVLAFDPGFQLSALAMVGLVLGTPVVSQYLLWVTERGGLRELVASSVSTQLAVLPLILYQDGQFSLLSLPANILAMIPIPVAMFASCLASLGGILAGTYATPLAYPAYLLLAYIISVGQFFASFTFASLSIGVFSVWWMFISYAVLINVCVYAQKKSGEGKNPTAAL
jgi:competence protein ComEC